MPKPKAVGIMPFKEGDRYIFVETKSDPNIFMEYTVLTMDTLLKYLTKALREEYNKRRTKKKGH